MKRRRYVPSPEQMRAYDAAMESFPGNHVPADNLANGRRLVALAIRLGDWEMLARFARSGLCLPHDFVADVLQGKARCANRPGTLVTKMRQAMMAACVKANRDRNISETDAVDQVAE